MARKNNQMLQDTTQLLTVQEAASFLNVHSNTLRRWSDGGILNVYRLGPRGDRRYRRGDIIRFINACDNIETA